MSRYRIKEDSNYNVWLEIIELEPLAGMEHGTLALQTDGYKQGPIVVLSPKQVTELRDWLADYVGRTFGNKC